MTQQPEIMRVLRSSPADLVRSLFKPGKRGAPGVAPRHSDVPELRGAEFSAVYYNLRVAGDFYEFLRVGPSRVLFAMLDLAGRRGATREILAAAQDAFRTSTPPLFAGDDFTEAEVIIELSHEINRTILQFAGGVRSCPTFIGCYNEDLGTVCYANAGHNTGTTAR